MRCKILLGRVAASTLLLALLTGLAVADEDAPPEKKVPPKSLDEQLLDDLDDSLFGDLGIPATSGDKTPASDAVESNPVKTDPDDVSTDDALRRDLPVGEDIGQESDANPLAEIALRMKQVERRIGNRETSSRLQAMQQDIVAELDRLIQQMQQQPSGGQSKSSPSSGSQQSSSQSSVSGAQESKQPATNSAPRLGKADGESADLAEMQKMLDEVWGHLPARVREQMQNATVEQFLPKYERLIEEYYKRLAETE
ncbi:MAG: hypothetical protein KDA71_07590 [Planctomycetales bacterium]|nr:hypothetical protein [Planctomycetales bacterium]